MTSKKLLRVAKRRRRSDQASDGNLLRLAGLQTRGRLVVVGLESMESHACRDRSCVNDGVDLQRQASLIGAAKWSMEEPLSPTR